MSRIAVLALIFVAGCAGSAVRQQANATDTLIATARANGAQRCAPVELAMAESHNDYAQHALDEIVHRFEVRIGLYLKIEATAFRLMTEGTRNHFQQACEEHFFGLHGHRSGFDF